ncbi:ABC transporter permease [uncultured Alistipes sp.]|uniref:ABC transporter permease n=1 Tax=uncultured Alistipes sp. TaxID=538949 RepID=UPI002639EDB6|nr:ABC transporter permease [uncultured Alistipes sp.]
MIDSIKNTCGQAWIYVRSFGLYTLLNVAGLGLSFACVMLLAMYVHREMTADRFHVRARQLYALSYYPGENVMNPRLCETSPQTDAQLDILAQPEVAAHTAVVRAANEVTVDGRRTFNAEVLRADSMFFRLFSFPVVAGNPQRMLSGPADAVLDSEFARRLFGDREAMGELVEFEGKIYTVCGIVRKPVQQSSIAFDVAVSYRGWKNEGGRGSAGCEFLCIPTPEQAASLAAKLDYDMPVSSDMTLHHSLIPLPELYFAQVGKRFACINSGTPTHLWILLVAAGIVLVIGFFNFANIYSVLLRRRSRELGLKKAYGATAGDIYAQFAAECFCLFAFAVAAAFLLVEYVRPLTLRWFGMETPHLWGFDLALMAVMLLVIPPLAALVPWLRYRWATPVDAIRRIGTAGGRSWGRYVFVELQYFVSIVFIVVSIYFVRQVHFLLNYDTGYNTKDILLASPIEKLPTGYMGTWFYAMDLLNGSDSLRQRSGALYQRVAQSMESTPAVAAWTFGMLRESFEMDIRLQGVGEAVRVMVASATAGMEGLYDFRLREGRFFRPDEGAYDNKLILTETVRRRLGIGDISQAVVEIPFFLWTRTDENGNRTGSSVYEVVGVIDDIRVGDPTQNDLPVVLMADWPEMNRTSELAVRYRPGQRDEVTSLLSNLYKQEGVQLEVTDMEARIAERYAENRRMARIYTAFALVAVFISVLGLYGQALFDLQQRRREIAIRKVCGATLRELLLLLLRRYCLMFCGAFAVAVPVSWWIVGRYTESFVQRAPLSWWIFAAGGALVAVVSLLTLLYRVRRAASEDPAKAVTND